VRKLPQGSAEQKDAKLKLPFFIPTGLFAYRNARGLRQHSGQVGIDLDALDEDSAEDVLCAAVRDKFCLAAFRSVRNGVRLLFRVSPVTAAAHRAVFKQVADHVRAVYGIEPDKSGSDVSRASFVSWDEGTWIYPRAKVFPVVTPRLEAPDEKAQKVIITTRNCKLRAPTLDKRYTWHRLMGQERSPQKPRSSLKQIPPDPFITIRLMRARPPPQLQTWNHIEQ
jgi:hypothetical protein